MGKYLNNGKKILSSCKILKNITLKKNYSSQFSRAILEILYFFSHSFPHIMIFMLMFDDGH